MERFDPSHESDAEAPEALVRALGSLRRVPLRIPTELDDRVLGAGRERLSRLEVFARPTVRWRLPLLSLAAGIVALALVAWQFVKPRPLPQPPPGMSLAPDANRDGRLDVLDAWTIARSSAGVGAGAKEWDVNGDGRVDRRDAEAVAHWLVRIDLPPSSGIRIAAALAPLEWLVPRSAWMNREMAARRRSSSGLLWAAAIPWAAAETGDEASVTPAPRFTSVRVLVDPGNSTLGAFQVEIRLLAEGVRVVGIEGGDDGPFREPPFYDPRALQQDRLILAGFEAGLNAEWPAGRTRVATLHILVPSGVHPQFATTLVAAGDAEGRRVAATVIVESTMEEK